MRRCAECLAVLLQHSCSPSRSSHQDPHLEPGAGCLLTPPHPMGMVRPADAKKCENRLTVSEAVGTHQSRILRQDSCSKTPAAQVRRCPSDRSAKGSHGKAGPCWIAKPRYIHLTHINTGTEISAGVTESMHIAFETACTIGSDKGELSSPAWHCVQSVGSEPSKPCRKQCGHVPKAESEIEMPSRSAHLTKCRRLSSVACRVWAQ